MRLYPLRLRTHFLYPIFSLLLIFTVLAILSPQPVRAAGIVVNSLADNTTSSDGFCTLREAINSANANSSTDCTAGSGADTITFNLDGTITLNSTLPNITSPVTIDGTGHTIAIDGNNGVGSFIQAGSFFVDTGGNLTLNALTIQNGNAGPNYGDRGGAVMNSAGTLTATNVTFTGNDANQGGAIYTDYTSNSTTITNSAFTGNSADEGAALYAFNSTINVTNSTFSSNTASDGGAIYDWGVVNVTDSTFTGNSASNNGGGIYNFGTLGLTNSTLSGSTSVSGGGIYNYSGALNMSKSSLSNNSATSNGGGIYMSDGPVTITNSTISGNSATTSAGAIYAYMGTLTVTGSTLSGNSAADGGLYQSGSVALDTYFAGNILDTGTSGVNCAGFVYIIDNGYNVSDDASCNFDMYAGSRNNAPLNLSGLASNDGGSTQTHAPAAGSAAIAVIPNGTAVNNNGVTLACAASTLDQNGITRPRITNGSCSSGAVEAAVAVISCPNTGNITTASDLNLCLIWSNANPGADTLTLGANITLNTELPYILSDLTLHGGGHIVDGNHAVRAFRVATTGNVSMDAITIQNGSSKAGGGISNSGTLTVSNSTISGNTVAGDGGGINNYKGILTISNSTISGNSASPASFGGGGVYSLGSLTITGSTISNNTSTDRGGGIYHDHDYAFDIGGPLTLTSTTVSGNSAVNGGGGLYARGGPATITSAIFSNNSAPGTPTTNSNGGGIYTTYGADLTVNNTSFTNNSAKYGGGLLTEYTSTVKNSTFSTNTAILSGGAVYNGDTMDMFNTTLSTNSATFGGALFSQGQTTVTNTTISGNNGSSYAGGIYSYSGGVYLAAVLLDTGSTGGNCIIDNSVGAGGQIYDSGYNLSDDTSCGFPLTTSADNVPLLLGTLQNNGGPTLTQLPGLGSPALDRIPNGTIINNNGTVYSCNQNGQLLDTDQRGTARPSPASGNCDVGAVELYFDFTAQKPVLVSPANGSSITTNPPKLVWNAVPTATSYKIFMDGNSTPTTLIATVNTTSYTLPNTLTVGKYYWQVQAVDASSQLSALSDIFNFTLESQTNAAPPRNFYTTDTPTLTWSAVPSAITYEIQVDNTQNFSSTLDFTASVPGDQLSVMTSSLDDGTYFWHVKACPATGPCGAWSTTDSFVVDAP